MKNPVTQAGIEPATFRFVAQRLNHCATAGSRCHNSYCFMYIIYFDTVLVRLMCWYYIYTLVIKISLLMATYRWNM